MPQKQSTYEASPTQATTRATGNWGGEGGEKSMAGAPRMGGAMGGLFGGLLGGSRSGNVTPNSVKGLMPQGGGGLLGGLLGAGRYTGIRDMFNGGGPGRSGEQFYGGGAMSAALNRAGVRPAGYSGLMAQMASQAAQKAAQPGYTPTGYGAAPAGGSGGVGGGVGGGGGGVGGGTGPSVTSPTGALPPMPVNYPGNAYVPVRQYMTAPQAAALNRLPFGAIPSALLSAGVGSPISAEEAAFLNLISTQSPLAQGSYGGGYIQPPAVPRAGGPYAGPIAQPSAAPQAAAAPSPTAGPIYTGVDQTRLNQQHQAYAEMQARLEAERRAEAEQRARELYQGMTVAP
jgi:hypothetical protein